MNGIVRVPTEGRLIILPGTLVEFRKKDTYGDGIGENGLLVQGHFIAKGTPQQPIIFRSAETTRRMGDWDAINILGSDRGQSIMEFCQFEDGYISERLKEYSSWLSCKLSYKSVEEVLFRHTGEQVLSDQKIQEIVLDTANKVSIKEEQKAEIILSKQMEDATTITH